MPARDVIGGPRIDAVKNRRRGGRFDVASARCNYAPAIGMNVEKLDIINSSLAAMLVSESEPESGVLRYFGAEVLFFHFLPVFLPLRAMRGINCASFDREISENSAVKNGQKYESFRGGARQSTKLKVVKNPTSNRYFHRPSKQGMKRDTRYLSGISMSEQRQRIRCSAACYP